jgi:hypothetical protein
MKRKKNLYTHSIDLAPLKIINRSREEFRQLLERIPYRGYEVEQLTDGRKIVITKPGGKFTYGLVRKEDFMVFVYNPKDSSLWLISHKDIYGDLVEKSERSPDETIKIIDALERVHSGEEPGQVLKDFDIENPCGEEPELLLKVYKWIWGQEDCNYPNQQGRDMCMAPILELRESLKI